MEVNKCNGALILPEFKRLVAECDFYAVDQEMTGIACAGQTEDIGMDLLEAYGPKRAAATRYTAFQIGIALFTKRRSLSDASTDDVRRPIVYDVRPFNIYLLGDADVTLNMSAVQFLLKNQMNFQTWLTSGMPYATAAKESAERLKLFPTDPWETLTVDEQEWVRAVEKRIVAWYADAVSEPTLELTEPHLHSKVDVALLYRLRSTENTTMLISISPSLDGGMPAFLRKKTTVTRLSSVVEMQRINEAETKRREELLENRLGFRAYWNALVASGKPQIGHNYASDLMFMLNQHHAVLPLSYTEFKETVHALFPVVYDTKTVAALLPLDGKDQPFRDTSLGPLFKDAMARWGKEIAFELPLGFEAYHPRCAAAGAGSAVAHQGAYDAYMTGIVFALLQRRLGAAVVEREALNLISVFGNHFCMDLDPKGKDGDRPVMRAVYAIEASTPKLRQDDLTRLFASDEQYAAMVAAAAAESRPPQTADYYLRVLDKAPYGSKSTTLAIVALFPPLHQLTGQDVERRLAHGIARGGASEREVSNVGTQSNSGDAPPLPLTFQVRTFGEWKMDLKTRADEPALKKVRCEEPL